MRVSILDDYFDTLRTLPCFAKLARHKITVWNDHVEDIDRLAERLHDTVRACAAKCSAYSATDALARQWRSMDVPLA